MRRALTLGAVILLLAGCLETLTSGEGASDPGDTPTLTVRPAPADLELPPSGPDASGATQETRDATADAAAPATPATETLTRPKTVRVRTLDAEGTVAEGAEPGGAQGEPAVPAAAVTAQSPAARACLSDGGRWARAGASGFICYRTPRDANKSCRRGSDCSGACLARSRTCAPIVPLLGCNEILTDSGARATECKDF